MPAVPWPLELVPPLPGEIRVQVGVGVGLVAGVVGFSPWTDLTLSGVPEDARSIRGWSRRSAP